MVWQAIMPQEMLDELAVENFRTYLRFPTVHPDIDYTDCVNWLRNQGEAIGLECFVTEPFPKNPILVMRWQGSNPDLRSIMLNSHMDVVPVDREKWSYDPFAAEMAPNGNIYGRGAQVCFLYQHYLFDAPTMFIFIGLTNLSKRLGDCIRVLIIPFYQDMKSVGIQHMECIRRLKLEGFVPKRTIYLTYVPDEEVGGGRGMQPFVSGKKPEHPGAQNEISFEQMNVGLCMDEGIASPLPNDYYAFYEERSPWWVSFRISGQAGHGSKFVEDTAVEKLHRLMGK